MCIGWNKPKQCTGGERLAERKRSGLSEQPALCPSAVPTGDWDAGRRNVPYPCAWTCPLIPRSFKKMDIRPAPSGAPEVFLRQPTGSVHNFTQPPRWDSGLRRDNIRLANRLRSGNGRAAQRSIRRRLFHHRRASAGGARVCGDRPRLLALLWSAKESALKALHEGLRLSTPAV